MESLCSICNALVDDRGERKRCYWAVSETCVTNTCNDHTCYLICTVTIIPNGSCCYILLLVSSSMMLPPCIVIMLACLSHPPRATAVFAVCSRFSQSPTSTFTCTPRWLRPVSGQAGQSLPVHSQTYDPPEFWSPEENDMMRNLHKQGMHPREMISYLSRRTLKSIAARVNLIFGKPAWPVSYTHLTLPTKRIV